MAVERLRPLVRHIAKAAEVALNLPEGSIRARTNDKRVILARHLVCWIARRRYGYSYPVIGKGVNRHHTTVLGSVNIIDLALANGEVHPSTIDLIDDCVRGKER